MAMADNVLYLDDVRIDRPRGPELTEAAELVAALSALVEAGLVVVHEHEDGPARYGTSEGSGEVA
jgi:hypothetical protein